jgi:hypothetical protein
MGYQECFILTKPGQSARDLIQFLRLSLSRFDDIECPGIAIFSCSINGKIYPDSEVNSVAEGQELVLSLGNRGEQVRLFSGIGLRWIYLDEVRGPDEVQGEDLFNKYERFLEVGEEVSNADESEALS